MNDLRDAFLLWFAGNIAFLFAAALHSYSDLAPLPLHIAMLWMAVTVYLAGAALFVLGGVSLFSGIRNLRKTP